MSAASPLLVRKAAVLGAGVMGAQIAAHLVNASVPAVLFELPAREGDPNSNALKAIDNLKRLEPSPLTVPSRAVYIQAANYTDHLALLGECDLVIEAIAERIDWKSDLYGKIAPHLGPQTVFASNTSGLSIRELAQALPAELRPRFCGVHFFNPPRYMHLVELIASRDTRPEILDGLETFLVTTLGKGVVRAKDTPNFIANRVGVFSMLATIHHAQRLGLGFDIVDALTGTLIGRPKSATFRTADVVGLDTFAHVVNTMKEALPQDPWHGYYTVPEWLKQLIAQGALGQKTRRGVYQKRGNDIHVLDLGIAGYRISDGRADEAIVEILKNRNTAERFEQLHASAHPQAQFLWSIYRDTFHYCAVHLAEIAHNARDLDLAIRWGFGWSQGPFEIWQAAGWSRVAGWISEDIAAGRANFIGVGCRDFFVIDNTRLGHVETLDAGRVGFQFLEPFRTDNVQPLKAVGDAAPVQFLKARQFLLAGGDDDFAADLIGHRVLVAEVNELFAPGDAGMRFERTWAVIKSRMNYATVVAGLMARQLRFFFQEQQAQPRMGGGNF